MSLDIKPGVSSKRSILRTVTKATKQKDAAGLGALAHAYHGGDRSMLDIIPDARLLKIVAEALERPRAFFEWMLRDNVWQPGGTIIQAAQQYLPAATWQWDKACILAGALLATVELPAIESSTVPDGRFPYWVALDKHTDEGKIALREVARSINASYRQLIWASFYCESALVNRLLRSPWFEAERTWRLRRAGLTWESAQELWSRARQLVQQHLASSTISLQSLIEATPLQETIVHQRGLF